MTIAFDAFSERNAAVVDPSWTHTPVGTPRGVLALVPHLTSQPIVGVTYGGVALTRVAWFDNSLGGEMVDTTLDAWFLGSSVPTGAQTVAVNGGASALPNAYAYTVTADADTEFVDDAGTESTSVSNVSATVSLGGRACFVAQVFGSGEDAVTSTAPLTNWTARDESDLGAFVGGSYSYDIVGTTDVTAGLTQSSDDVLLLAVAISEVVGGGGAVIPAAWDYYARLRH